MCMSMCMWGGAYPRHRLLKAFPTHLDGIVGGLSWEGIVCMEAEKVAVLHSPVVV